MTTPTRPDRRVGKASYLSWHPNAADCPSARWEPDPGVPYLYGRPSRDPWLAPPEARGAVRCPGHRLQGPPAPILTTQLKEARP